MRLACCLARGSLRGGSVGGLGVGGCRCGVDGRGCGREYVAVGGAWGSGGLMLLWTSLWFFLEEVEFVVVVLWWW